MLQNFTFFLLVFLAAEHSLPNQLLAEAPNINGTDWHIYAAQYDFSSNIGPVKFKNGEMISFPPAGEGQVIAIGSYKQITGKLKLVYTVVSVYGVPECQSIKSESDRKECKKAAEVYNPSKKVECIFNSDPEHPFYSAYFKCNNGSILGSEKYRVPVGADRIYQGIRIIREEYLGKIADEKCAAFEEKGEKEKALRLFNSGIVPAGVKMLVLGESGFPLKGNKKVPEVWKIVFLHTEPIISAPVWLPKRCVKPAK